MNYKRFSIVCGLSLLVIIASLQVNYAVPGDNKTTDFQTMCYNAAAAGGALVLWKTFPWLKKKFSSNPLVNMLGYDPKIRHSFYIPKQDVSLKESVGIPLSTSTPKIPVVTSMGFGDREGTYKARFNTEKTFTITFNYQDSFIKSFNPIAFIESLRTINLGQENDARALLYVIIQCYKQGYKKIHIFGHSRGGATAIKTLDMLSNPQKYQDIWKLLGITQTKEQSKIKEMVKAGEIHIAHPLMNPREAIKCHTGIYLQPVGNFIFESGTHYRDPQETPLEIIENNISKPNVWSYNLTATYADKDTTVGDSHVKKLQELSKKYKNFTYTKGGKHHTDIKEQIKAFRETLSTITQAKQPKIDIPRTITAQTIIPKIIKNDKTAEHILHKFAQALHSL